jgi:hypothetical protein
VQISHSFGRAFHRALIPFIIYLCIPLLAIFLFGILKIISFDLIFIYILIPFGITATIMAFFQNLYEKGTRRYALIGIILALYRGLYLFYLFGGFFNLQHFGSYHIEALGLQISLYIQLIAILLLVASFLNSIYYIQLYREAKDIILPEINQTAKKEELML